MNSVTVVTVLCEGEGSTVSCTFYQNWSSFGCQIHQYSFTRFWCHCTKTKSTRSITHGVWYCTYYYEYRILLEEVWEGPWVKNCFKASTFCWSPFLDNGQNLKHTHAFCYSLSGVQPYPYMILVWVEFLWSLGHLSQYEIIVITRDPCWIF